MGRKSCSQLRSQWGRPGWFKLEKANARAVAIRELGSASLHKSGVASLPDEAAHAPGREATTVGTDRTPRGERRQRVQKEPAGTWETRFGVFRRQPLTGSHNRRRGRIAASEGLIVAVEVRASRGGAKVTCEPRRRPGWSQGARAGVMPIQSNSALIDGTSSIGPDSL